MEKKLWSKAEIVELGVESTRDSYGIETIMEDGEEKRIYVCNSCGAKGSTLLGICHKNWCPKVNDPAEPGFGPEGPVTPALS